MTTAIDINQQKNHCNIYNYLSSINIISILLLQGQDDNDVHDDNDDHDDDVMVMITSLRMMITTMVVVVVVVAGVSSVLTLYGQHLPMVTPGQFFSENWLKLTNVTLNVVSILKSNKLFTNQANQVYISAKGNNAVPYIH